MSELARWDHVKWLQGRLGQARADLAIAEARVAKLEKALQIIKRRINQYDDMDDATMLAWIEDECDRAVQ
jgi:hypothetical protein